MPVLLILLTVVVCSVVFYCVLLIGVFMMVAFGIVAGIFIISIEIAYKRHRRLKEKEVELAKIAADRWRGNIEVTFCPCHTSTLCLKKVVCFVFVSNLGKLLCYFLAFTISALSTNICTYNFSLIFKRLTLH